VHEWRVRSCCGCYLLFGLADLRVTFGKLQADGLGHVGVEPDALLQKNWPWRKKKENTGGGREREKSVLNTTQVKKNYKKNFPC
jgi:hypothetical protein